MDNIDEASEVIPLNIVKSAEEVIHNSLPAKSKIIYKKAYEDFKTWMRNKKTNSFSELVLLAYLKDLSASMRPSSLWSKYSMLRTMIKLEKNVDISSYENLRLFLKRINVGFKPKKAKIFSADNIKKFLTEALDDEFLDVKTALVIGITGACQREELSNLLVDDITDEGTHLIVRIQKTKTNISRTFTISTPYRDIILKYSSKRPNGMESKRFFLNYKNGKCTRQHIGLNKLGRYPSTVASWLGLSDAKDYTGHSFRRTSATLLADSGASMTTLKRHGGWRSAQVAEGYIDDSINNKRKICSQITQSIDYDPNDCESQSTSSNRPLKSLKLSEVGDKALVSGAEASKNNNILELSLNQNTSSSSTMKMNLSSCIMQ